MNELIKVASGNIGGTVRQTVNARDLHASLEVGKDFSTWVKVQITRARLVESRDYTCSPSRVSSSSGAKHAIDYHLTLDAGKQIAMMSETDKGFEVRDYFLECERRALAAAPTPVALSPAEMFLQNAQLLVAIESRAAKMEQAQAALSVRLDAVADTAALKECPANAEPISHIRKRISKLFGLPVHIIDTAMRQLPYSPKPAGMVINSHEGAQGSHYAAFWTKDVTAMFKRFVSECHRETTSFVSHPFIDVRFKLSAGMECK